jgi:hypothetical protein
LISNDLWISLFKDELLKRIWIWILSETIFLIPFLLSLKLSHLFSFLTDTYLFSLKAKWLTGKKNHKVLLLMSIFKIKLKNIKENFSICIFFLCNSHFYGDLCRYHKYHSINLYFSSCKSFFFLQVKVVLYSYDFYCSSHKIYIYSLIVI